MSSKKKAVRESFRNAVFTRDRNRCKKCGVASEKLDAHHITDRNEMPNGGYVAENGISLCEPCHAKAEEFHSTGTSHPGYSPDDLYRLIGSTKEKAQRASERL